MHAACHRVTAVIRTAVTIVAWRRRDALACAVFTLTFTGASIAIIASGRVRTEDTIPRFASLIGARVSVVTGERQTTHAGTIEACIVHRAGIAIVTSSRRGLVGATTVGQARIHGAGIAIIAC